MSKLFQPTVVIGLGGTGKGVLLSLKKMIAENSPNGMSDYPLLRLISIDTDTDIKPRDSSIKTISKNELTLSREKEICYLHADYGLVPDLNNFPDINSWFPSVYRHQLSRTELEKGAGQKKPIGRFSFAWNADSVRRCLENLLRNPVDVATAKMSGIGSSNLSPFTNVFICGSLCGGTGSGTFLDIAYLVRFIAASLNRPIYIYGLLALSSIFEGLGGDANFRPNCYASLMELDHFMNQMNFSNEHRRFFPSYKNIGLSQWDYSRSAADTPFNFPFLFDKTNEAGFALNSPAAFSEMAARFIYLLTGHEVAKKWQSMDNNVRKLLDVSYREEIMNKPNNYRSMGTFSLLFPRRMVSQICAYRLACSYFEKILDDSYNPQEIENLVERFLDENHFNPETGSLLSEFDNFHQGDSPLESFSAFLENRKDEILSESPQIEKREIVQKVREWRESMEKILGEYKKQNSVCARNLLEKFLSDYKARISSFTDLTKRKDESNRTGDGEPRIVRGSIVRALKFTENLQAAFVQAAEKFRKEEEKAAESVPSFDSDFKSALSDLEEAADGFFSTKGKINERLETALDSCLNYLNSKRIALIHGWARQFFCGIREENNVLKRVGAISELEKSKLVLQRAVNEFSSIFEESKSYLSGKKNYEADYQCDVLFDYDEDVDGSYQKLLEEKGEEFIFADLSRKLKDKKEAFGDDYSEIANLSREQMKIAILHFTEEYFFEIVSRVNIADKLLKTPEKLNLLLNGNYYNNAGIYLNLDGAELARVNLDLKSNTFFAITIPDRMGDVPYENCPCRANGEGGDERKTCPVDDNPESFKGDKACPNYPNCLKKHIMDNAPRNLTIVPTDDKAEVNIVATIAGFPLHAVSTARNVCKPIYEQRRQKFSVSELHAFGNVEFDDICTKSENPEILAAPFRKTLIFALCLGRLSIQPLSVDFVTQRDLRAKRRDKPSLHLGKSIDEVMARAQSTKSEDLAMVHQIQDEMEFFKNEVISDKGDLKNRVANRLKSAFSEFSQELPEGIRLEDLDTISEISEEICGTPLIEESEEIDWGI